MKRLIAPLSVAVVGANVALFRRKEFDLRITYVNYVKIFEGQFFMNKQ